MKIGLTTLHNYNYGSALQCFALQSYLNEHFAECELLCKAPQGGRLLSLSKTAWELGLLCLKNPGHAADILRIFLSQRGKSLTLQAPSKAAIQQFVRSSLNKRTLTWKQLCLLGQDPEYGAFITGSDQVWNGARIDGYNMYFLRFAPARKRIAYAPSFGGAEVAGYNRKKYRKFISEFTSLSAREASGAQIIQAFTNRSAPVLADPVCLLNAEQWREYIADNTLFPGEPLVPAGDYILAFFLDQPSETALCSLQLLQKQTGFPIYSIGYHYASLDALENYRHLDGSPWEFLRLIDGAGTVLTDSFHATVFSLIFHTPFYVYSRSYTHSQNQSVRITGLLENVGMGSRFDSQTPNNEEPFSAQQAEAFFSELRKESHTYLAEALGIPEKAATNESQTIELVSHKAACCGCGACAEVCPVGAITMVQDESGAEYPVIDQEKCIRCGACLRVCALKKDVRPGMPTTQQAYVGFGTDEGLTEKSSSGGIFAVLARSVLAQGGAVFGAAVCADESGLHVRHICVEDPSQLHRIQGSKYTQSSTLGIFSQVKETLDGGRTVLFSGTSCQVAALKAFLKKDYSSLYTVDLVCHGVPGSGFFKAHEAYLEKKYRIQLTDFSFRRKDANTPYVLTVTGARESGKVVQKQIKLRDSAYYRLFMGCEGYRESCYRCPYASLKKPADITLGDYVPDAQERQALSTQPRLPYYSFILTNSEAGQALLEQNAAHICRAAITLEKARRSHHNLQNPSSPSNPGLYGLYRTKGFRGVEHSIRKRNLLTAAPRLARQLLRRVKR